MDTKIELYAAICGALARPDAMAAIWEILQGYNVTQTAAAASLPESIRQFIDAKRADGLSERTLKNYEITLRLFTEYVDKPPTQITTDDVRSWLAYLRTDRGLGKSSIQCYLNCLRSFFAWLTAEEKITRNPMLRIRSARIDKKHSRHPLTTEEVERVRACLKTPREKALVEMYLSTGCRLSELVGLHTDRINWQARSIEVSGKGNKIRTVYFSVRAKLALQAYLAISPDPSVMFVQGMAPYAPLGTESIQRIMHKIGVRAGLASRLHPHKLRHTFASSALNSGMDITIIQQLLGHESLDTTQIYAEFSQETVRHSYDQLVA